MSEKIKQLLYLEKKSSVDIYNHLQVIEKDVNDDTPIYEDKFKIKDLINLSSSGISNDKNRNENEKLISSQNITSKQSQRAYPCHNESVLIHDSICNQELEFDDYNEEICTFNPRYRLEKHEEVEINRTNSRVNRINSNSHESIKNNDLNSSLQYLNEVSERSCTNQNPIDISNKLNKLSIINNQKNFSQSTFDLSCFNLIKFDNKNNNSQHLMQSQLQVIFNIIKNFKQEMIDNILTLNNFTDNIAWEMNLITNSKDKYELIENCRNSFDIFKRNINEVTHKYEKELKSVTGHLNKESLGDWSNKEKENGSKIINNSEFDKDNKVYKSKEKRNSISKELNQYNLNISYLNKEILENSQEIKYSMPINHTKEFIENLILNYEERLKEKNTEFIKLKETCKIKETLILSSKNLIEELHNKNKLLKDKLIKYKIRFEELNHKHNT